MVTSWRIIPFSRKMNHITKSYSIFLFLLLALGQTRSQYDVSWESSDFMVLHDHNEFTNVEKSVLNDGGDRSLQSVITLPLRINCGNILSDVTEPLGVVWTTDKYFLTGSSFDACQSTAKSGITLFNKDCVLRQGVQVVYQIPVPSAGQYTVNFHFTEPFWKIPGKRIFNLTAESTTVVSNLDLVAQYGYGVPAIISRVITVIDGKLSIRANAVADLAVLNGIEIMLGSATVPIPSPPVQLPTIRINTGSNQPWTDSATGIVWGADRGFSGGSVLNACPRSISGTALGTIFCSERTFVGTEGSYVLPILPGTYTNNPIASNLDIFALRGSNNAYQISQQVTVPSTDSNVRIRFVNGANFATIAGIEIKPSTSAPSTVPVPAPTNPPPTGFQNILINCGSTSSFVDSLAQTWSADKFFVGGTATTTNVPIDGTVDDPLYQVDRSGATFGYEIPLPIGVYEVNLYFAEAIYLTQNQRVFDLKIESTVRPSIDILKLAAAKTATKITFFQTVDDGSLSIQLSKSAGGSVGNPKLNAIEIKLDKPHIAHAVATGPYSGTVVDATGKAKIMLTGQTSHTHGTGLNLIDYTWKEASVVLGKSVNTEYGFTAGNHTISLTVKDDGGNTDTEITTVSIKPFGYPAITSLAPSSGGIAGNFDVIIRGSGFTYTAAQTTVIFGTTTLTGTSLVVIDSTSIRVKAPPSTAAIPVRITVRTPLGLSDATFFSYVGSEPIQWQSSLVTEYTRPTVGRFGPDKKLYVGTRNGRILKITMSPDFTTALNVIVAFVNTGQEAVLGIAFDPLDTGIDPRVYFTFNKFFHKGELSSSGTTVDGKIRMASGPNLETITDIITGLPISDLDHGLNGIEFGDNGELYFTSGSHTNGGVPGKLSSSGLLKENFLSAAINVAYLSHPDFDGAIKWSAPDDGNMIAKGIDVFAPGLRNPYSIVLHSNGKLYATCNGPNPGYGRMSTGCGPLDNIDDKKADDTILHIQKGKYYGSPNFKRATFFNDPRQCVWYPATAKSNPSYTGAMITGQSSIDGILEFHSNHFGGQLRNNLIFIRYNGINNIYRVVLTPDGTAVLPTITTPIPMNIGNLGLDLTQAPNGNLIEMRYQDNTVYVHKPVELPSTLMKVKTAFPRRGRSGGGNILNIYGINFALGATVTVGGKNCPVISVTTNQIDCTLPGGIGTVDIIVTLGTTTSVFQKGYRYISGVPPPGFVLPVYTG